MRGILTARLVLRNDPEGQGHFEASRGVRLHRGMDFFCDPTAIMEAPIEGIVTKLGFPYGDDLAYRYVEITCEFDMTRHRVFYIQPGVVVGDLVYLGNPIGSLQDVTIRYPQYPRMRPHAHYEIITRQGVYIDPEKWHKKNPPARYNVQPI